MKWIAFVLGWWVFRPYSLLVGAILRLKGIRVGRGFYIQGVPYLKIRGRAGDISIGDNVSIFGDVDLRNREQGRITIEDGVVLDANCRLIAANEAELLLKSGCHIGPYCVFNCGTDVTVGANTLLAGFCYVQSSNHGIKKGRPIKKQPHNYGKIEIGEDSWLGSHVSVLAGSNIAQGTVVGSKAVVTGETEPYSIYAGVPARKISERPD